MQDEARRLQYLAAMGIRAWHLRDRSREGGAPAVAAEPAQIPAWPDEPPPWNDDDIPEAAIVEQDAEKPAARARLAAGDSAPASRYAPSPEAAAAPGLEADARRSVPPPVEPQVAAMDWQALEAAVTQCRGCVLCETRTNTVFGVGDRKAELMLIGEAPGQDEDRQGEPFVGRAGRLLNKMLSAIGLQREQVYIANIVKCRPPRNRNPAAEEATACRAYLARQIALVRPRLILSLGAVSANNLLGNTDAVGRLRGRLHHYRPGPTDDPIPLIVTYHPSYYLRSPAEKAKGWQDLQQVMAILREQGQDD
jgi:DNA polymerase